jgi:hypothetical protein
MVTAVNLNGWDWLLNLIPVVGTMAYGAKKTGEAIYNAATKDDNKIDCSQYQGQIALRCTLKQQGMSTEEIQRVAPTATFKYDAATAERLSATPWYTNWTTYGLAAVGVVAVVAAVKLLTK